MQNFLGVCMMYTSCTKMVSSARTLCFFFLHILAQHSVSTLRLLIFLSKISPYPIACCCVVYSMLPSSLAHPISRCVAPPSSAPIHPASCPLPRHDVLHPPLPSLQLAARMPHCYATCPVPRTRRGAADAAVPYQKVVGAVDAMAAAMRDLSKEILR
jgi:hypothetical protein